MLYKTITLKELREGECGRIVECRSAELNALGIKGGDYILALRKRKNGGIFVIGGRYFALSSSFFGEIKLRCQQTKGENGKE